MILTFMHESLQKELINVVVLDSFGHFFIEVPGLPWLHLLNVERLCAGGAELVFLQQRAIVWAEAHFWLLEGLLVHLN